MQANSESATGGSRTLPPQEPTASELQFEAYLQAHGLNAWEKILRIEGKPTPDYKLDVSNKTYFFEVKEFDSAPPTRSYGRHDPYPPVRRKIHKATRQFKNYTGSPCSVVIANPKPIFQSLGRSVILGAMFGNPGFRIAFDPKTGKSDGKIENVFLAGGELIHPNQRKPKNTRISAVIVVAPYELRPALIRLNKVKWQGEVGRELDADELFSLFEAFQETEDLRPMRVAVYENPFAKVPIDRHLFCGPYDERWGERDGFITRIYAGEGCRRVEAALPPEEWPP